MPLPDDPADRAPLRLPWAGAWLAYAFLGDPARLRLTFSYDPESVLSSDDQPPDRAAAATAAAAAGQALLAALDASNATVTLAASVLPDQPLGGPALRAWLRECVTAAGEALAPVAADGTTAGEAVTRSTDIAFDPGGLAGCSQDVVALTVTLALGGQALPLRPDLGPGDETALRAFAAGCAAAFDGFDGNGGAARIAADASEPGLWVVRWSATGGLHLAAADSGGVACLAPAPLSVGRCGGVAEVPEYDSRLAATVTTRTFIDVDLDQWARAALAGVDEVFAPDVAAVVAALDEAAYDDLVAARDTLRAAVAAGVRPVFAGAAPTGDQHLARAAVARSMHPALTAAYDLSAVVQVPIAVTAAGPDGAALSGTVALAGDLPYTVAAGGTLPLAPDTAWLTVLVSAADAGAAPYAALPLTYRVRAVELAADGDRPARSLRIVGDEDDAAFGCALGTVGVPLPVRVHPAPPVWEPPTAAPDPAGGDGIAGYLRWAYTVSLAVPDARAQDALWGEVTYDAGRPPLSAVAPAPPSALFQALASFVTAWPVLAPYVTALPKGDNRAGPAPGAVVAAVRTQVRLLADAWAAWRGLPAAPAPVLAAHGDRFVVDFAAHAEGTLVVRAPGTDAAAMRWPVVNGATPRAAATQAEPGWYGAEYDAGPTDSTLTLCWPGLDLVAAQAARSSYSIVRNGGLSSDPAVRTDPAFVYRTPVVATPPVVPLVAVPPLGPLTPADPVSLCRSLCAVLAPLADVATGVTDSRLLRVGVAYSYALAKMTGRAEEPVVLIPPVPVAAGGSCDGCDGTAPPDGPPTVAQVCAQLAAACQEWWRQTRPAADDARLVLTGALYAEVAGEWLPVVTCGPVSIVVAPGWWPAS